MLFVLCIVDGIFFSASNKTEMKKKKKEKRKEKKRHILIHIVFTIYMRWYNAKKWCLHFKHKKWIHIKDLK